MGAGIVGICVSLASSVLPLFIFVFWLIGSTVGKLFDKFFDAAIYPNLPSTKKEQKALEKKWDLQLRRKEETAIKKGNYRTELVEYIIIHDMTDCGFTPHPSELRRLRKRHPDLADKIADPDYFTTEEFLEKAERCWNRNLHYTARMSYERWLKK